MDRSQTFTANPITRLDLHPSESVCLSMNDVRENSFGWNITRYTSLFLGNDKRETPEKRVGFGVDVTSASKFDGCKDSRTAWR
jgi:hypothetical protein